MPFVIHLLVFYWILGFLDFSSFLTLRLNCSSHLDQSALYTLHMGASLHQVSFLFDSQSQYSLFVKFLKVSALFILAAASGTGEHIQGFLVS